MIDNRVRGSFIIGIQTRFGEGRGRHPKPTPGRFVALLIGMGACVLIILGVFRHQQRLIGELIQSRLIESLSGARYQEPSSAVVLRMAVLGVSTEAPAGLVKEVTALVESAVADGWVDEDEVKVVAAALSELSGY